MGQYFPKTYEPFGGDIKLSTLKLICLIIQQKQISKRFRILIPLSFALKSNLTSLKIEIRYQLCWLYYKLDIDKLVPVPVDLRKLSDVAKNDVVKKALCDKLVAKVNSIGTSRFALKTKYDTDQIELENKIPDTSGLAMLKSLK